MTLRCRCVLAIGLAMALTACDKEASAPRSQAPLAQPATLNEEETPPKSETLFSEQAAQRGLTFTHFSAGSTRYYFPEIMGSGVAVLDYDNDGDLDVFVAQGAYLAPDMGSDELRTDQPLIPSDRLFQNQLIPSGELSFEDVTDSASIDTQGYSMGIATGDVDSDGLVDIYVARFGSNSLLRNLGNGQFEDVIQASGSDDERWNSSAAFFDYDSDGDLDLFLTAYVAFNRKYEKQCVSTSGEPDYCSPQSYKPLADRLFRNNGQGKFTDVSAQTNVNTGVGSGLGVVFDDYNGDGLLDVYVANDGNENFLWMNQERERFEQNGMISGTAFNQDGKVEASMGVVSGDYDNDGDPDLFMTHLKQESNTLYTNNGQGIFQDTTTRTRLKQTSLPLTGFGTVWIDYDNDGWLDLYIANGGVIAGAVETERTDAAYAQHDQLYRNESGKRFADITEYSGPAFDMKSISRGVAKGDIDNDGDIDLIVSDNNAALRLLVNENGNEQSWLRVKLDASSGNQQGIGARVGLDDGNDITWRRVRTDGSYQSANEAVAHFGLGENNSSQSVIVEWTSGKRERWSDLSSRTLHTLQEGSGSEMP